MTRTVTRLLTMLALVIGLARLSFAGNEEVRTFDVDPHWEKFGITRTGDHTKQAVQDFGWCPSNKSGGAAAGEIGGVVTRSFTRSVYWTKIGTKTLNDKLTISGRFAIHQTKEHSAVLLGFFNENSRGRRPLNSLVLYLGGENKQGGNDKRRHGQFSRVFANVRNADAVFKEVGAFDGRLADTKTAPILSDVNPVVPSASFPSARRQQGAHCIVGTPETWYVRSQRRAPWSGGSRTARTPCGTRMPRAPPPAARPDNQDEPSPGHVSGLNLRSRRYRRRTSPGRWGSLACAGNRCRRGARRHGRFQ